MLPGKTNCVLLTRSLLTVMKYSWNVDNNNGHWWILFKIRIQNSTGSAILHISIRNACTFWNSYKKIIPILPSIAVWKFMHLINREKKNQMHCMADWFMLNNALYLWTLRLQVRLDCVTFVSEHSVQMWLNRYVRKKFFQTKAEQISLAIVYPGYN